MCLWMYIGSHVTGNDVTWPEVTRKWRHLNHQLANIHIEQQAVYKIRVRLISHITPLHTCRAVAMRFEVVRLQWGVTLPKAMAQRRVVPIIPCKVRKNFSPSFLGYQDGLSWHLRAWKTRKCCFQTICSHRSLLFSVNCGHVAANWSARHATEFKNVGRNVVVVLKSGLVETGPTILVATALTYNPTSHI